MLVMVVVTVMYCSVSVGALSREKLLAQQMLPGEGGY